MTLDVENIHSVVHHRDPLCTVLHARNFGNGAKGGIKRTTHWAAIYFTNPKSWYPVPERAVFLSAIPVTQPLPAVPMTPQCVQVMRDWAQTFGAAVRQHSGNEAGEEHKKDGILEYDSSSSNDLDDESTDNDKADDDVGGILLLDHKETFVLGTVSHFGRTVHFNSGIIV
ncbi:hypothetical protein AWC38_SpisGene2475 [Stylophora pistillata]|uniref:Uncharacterized protein n=1 Tax=Stylophora pistillata TaxID=50429 RepID=A0A2B4SVV5_STYPI|nr:hypothetical protein AWC38_SpisGene2475 [Stylophora pistillata]